MKRIICLVLCLCTALAVLPSCFSDEGGEQVTTVTDAATTTASNEDSNATVLQLFVAGAAKFAIVIPEGNDEMFEAADATAEMFAKYCGEKPAIKLDSEVGKNDDLQILIGETIVPETAEALLQVKRYKDYFCGVVGNKLVLVGKTDSGTKSAVNYFQQTYIMPNKKGSKADLSFSSAKNRLYMYNYNINTATVAGEDLNGFTIVYPDNYFAGERYAAVRLQYHLFDYGGFIIPAETESTVKNEKQIVFKTQPGSDGFSIKMEGKKLVITGDDLFDFQDALTYLSTKVFAGSKDIAVPADYSYTSKNTSDILRKCTGDYRIIFHNIWGMDEQNVAPEAIKNNAAKKNNIRDDNEVALLLAYQPDVICLNEYYGIYSELDVVKTQLLANGYTEAPVVKPADSPGSATLNVMPVFYKTSRFNWVEGTYSNFEVRDISKGMTLAVLEDKVTGKKMGVAAVHLSSMFGLNTIEEKMARQANEALVVATELKRVSQKYGDIPMFFGGDMNCEFSQDTVQWFLNNGFASLHEIAADKNNICSCVAYPTYSEMFKVYNYGLVSTGNYAASIDHSFVLHQEKTDIKTYRIMPDPIAPMISDHIPQMVDFSLN